MSVTKKPCTAYWIEPNGGLCPNAPDNKVGLPIGAHTCAHVDTYSEHEQQVHPKCECRCGATHKKPVAQLMIDRHEAKQRQVSINCGPGGEASVVVGGVDIANVVTSVDIKMQGMQPTRATLGMEHVRVIAEAQGELDERTARALEALGWSGPDTELLRRRDLQEALNIDGSVLREWDQLVEHAKAVADGYTQVVLNEDETLHKVAAALGGYAPDEIKWSRVIEAVVELAVRVEGLDK